MPEQITLDLDSLTLGELMEAERQSGQDAQVLLTRSTHRRALAVFVYRWRTSGHAPSWSEVAGLRLLDASSSTSRSPQADPSPTSQD